MLTVAEALKLEQFAGAEVVAGNERPHDGLRNGLRPGATDGKGPPGVAGLHCG